MDIIEITEESLDGEKHLEIVRRVTQPNTGATSIFMGTTRDFFEDKKVIKLEYEAYESMAKKELKKICEQAREKYAVEKIAVLHRLGEVPVCETSVLIVISAPHRNAAIDATKFVIDTLKATVPIWKKEIYEDGSCNWKENKECSWTGKD
ncbi:unnamed protein product [Owenia fusiformis]|uniref:Molybdopterin synthase catalytic subunit n=1 Tax=Owenia fusiformis TaxID=6347 RepID=A0A8J1TUM6_OWEFU|nr:unnamed protein product [Owenia fusiformis]